MRQMFRQIGSQMRNLRVYSGKGATYAATWELKMYMIDRCSAFTRDISLGLEMV